MDIEKIIADAVEKALKEQTHDASFQPSPEIQTLIDQAVQKAIRNMGQKE